MNNVLTLARYEARLLSREWAAMVFAFVFPPITMLVIAGSFGDQPDEGFGNLIPTDFYITGYFGVPMAAIGLIGVPVMLASYRERDVLRRFEAFGVPTSTVVAAQTAVGATLIALAGVIVLAVAAPIYGIPALARPAQVVTGAVAGAAALLSLGAAFGLVARSARSAQAIGLLAFFPMFLLSGGGPPPDVMTAPMRRIADVLPLTHAIGAIRDPWLDDGSITGHVAALVAWTLVGLTLTWRLARRVNHV